MADLNSRDTTETLIRILNEYTDNERTSFSGEDEIKDPHWAAWGIQSIARGLGPLDVDPAGEEAKLEEVIDAARVLEEMVRSIDRAIVTKIDRAGRQRTAERLGIDPREYYIPHFELPFPRMLSALSELQMALVETIDQINELSSGIPKRLGGPKPNLQARKVAGIVASHFRYMTGELPASRNRYGGSKFEETLTKIFKLLGIDAHPRRPAEWALSELAKNE